MTPEAETGTIMVVDDTPANLDLLNQLLKERGYAVRSFPRGELALKSALANPPDLILLDVNMPEINGYEVCLRLKSDDRTRDIPVIFISALTDTSDKIAGFHVGGVDYITKPFHMEEVYARVDAHMNLVRANRLIREQNTALSRSLAELKTTQEQLVQSEKMAALGVLTAGVAHEINNPINFIKTGCLGLTADFEDMRRVLQAYEDCLPSCPLPEVGSRIQALKKEIDYETLTDEIPKLADHVLEGVRRTEEIVNSLRLYSRMDSQTGEPVQVHALVDAALVILQPRIRNQVRIVKQYGEIPEINGQPGRLIQVFTNILANAIDAVQAGITEGEPGMITIETRYRYLDNLTWAEISFQDTGIGIPSDFQEKVFDPFFTTKEVGKGTGLGLSISFGIVQDHQGTIELKSDPGRGTTVTVLLPIDKEKI
jgi:signal transduction histidine kinase